MQSKDRNIKYNKFVCDFYNNLSDIGKKDVDLIFLCIGTDRMTGDCFGPLVGDKIKENILKEGINARVYGNLENPVVSYNINKIIKNIKEKYDRPCIVAIDAALSKPKNIGSILVKKGGIKSGAAIKKANKEIGNISIRGIIGEDYKKIDKNIQMLQSTPLGFVRELADVVADGIIEVLKS